MSRNSPRPRGLAGGVLAVVVAVAAAGLGWLLVAGSTRLPETRRAIATEAARSVDTLDAARQTLLREPSYANCKAFLHQLEAHRERNGQQPGDFLDESEQKILRDHFGLPVPLVAELSASHYSPVDAKFLEWGLLVAEVSRSAGWETLPERERALAAFQWVVRQLRDDGQSDGYFPQQLLDHGVGSRSLVFPAVLEQLGIPAYRIDWPDEKSRRSLIGAALDDQLYLFDCEYGVPVSAATGRNPATLAELCGRPEHLPGIEAADAVFRPASATVYRCCAWCALAPRMKPVQAALAGQSTARLHVDPAGCPPRLRQVLQGLPIREADPGVRGPASLHLFGSPPLEEGGAASGRAFAGQTPISLRFHASIIPWDHLPGSIQGVEATVGPGARSRALFAAPFENFYLKPGGPRDLLIRGRLEPASAALVELRDQLHDLQRQARATPKLQPSVAEWCRAARQAQADVLVAQGKGAQAEADLTAAQERLQQLWSKEQFAPVLLLLHASAAGPLGVEVEYQLALCKHEQAERLQLRHDHKQADDAATLRDAWQSAAERWQKYIDEYPKTPGEGQARLLGARALEMLGERDAALALVQAPPEPLNPWDRRACLYRARLLKREPRP